ncbi:hypothetical protein TNCV_1506461 [Trichonephila clavipes]|nr:hypothetical protein TNCV_1506461 [Trichonephila clavipes]
MVRLCGTCEHGMEKYGDRNMTEISRIQLRYRLQKPGESLQELTSDVSKLSPLAFGDFPVEVQESLAVQYFTDAVHDPDVL